MRPRTAWYGTALLLLALRALCGTAPVATSGAHLELMRAAAPAPPVPAELVASFTRPGNAALVPSWNPATALGSRGTYRSTGRALSSERAIEAAGAVSAARVRTRPARLRQPECAAAAALLRAGARSSFGTSLPPPARV